MRLTAKLSLMLSALAIGVLASALALLYVAERDHLLAQVESALAKDMMKLARVCADSVADDNELARLTYMKTYVAAAEPGFVRRVAFLDPEGRVLMHSDFLGGDFSRLGTPAEEVFRRAAESGRTLTQDAGTLLLVLSRPVLVGSRRVGTVSAAFSSEAVARSVEQIQRESLLRFAQVTVVGMALSVLAALLLARHLARPIREIGLGAREIGHGKWGHRIAVARGDELGDLAREFNAMAQRLAELDELKDSFLSKITHDLRNPLAAIIGYVELILMGMQGPLTAKQEASLKVVSFNGAFLNDLINNILDLTKLEAGRMEFVRKPVSLRPCAEAVVALMTVKADEFGVRIDCARVPDSVTVLADEQALRRTLINLISNALKFTPKGGVVSVEAACQPTGETRVSVRDTGIGIPPDKLGILFKKFAQVAETRDVVRESKGTGLGLVICKEIVEAHGGRIWVESVYRKGTAFHFTIPAASTDAGAPRPEVTRAG